MDSNEPRTTLRMALAVSLCYLPFGLPSTIDRKIRVTAASVAKVANHNFDFRNRN